MKSIRFNNQEEMPETTG